MTETEFSVIRRVPITEARLTASSVAEPALGVDPDPAAWSAATAYAAGARVSRFAIHKIYQRVTAGTTASAPEADVANWQEVGSTNRWRMFDEANESQSSAAEQLVVVLTLGELADRLVVLNVQGATARLQVADSDYDRTVSLLTRSVTNWYEYFFEPFESVVEVVFEDLPLRPTNVVTLTISNPGGVARVGNCVPGLAKTIGSTERGATAGITDYSVKSTNAFGNTAVVKRPYSKRMNVTLWVPASRVDAVQRFLADLRATPAVYVGAGSLYGALIVYGYFRSFELVLAYPNFSKCNLEIEGLT